MPLRDRMEVEIAGARFHEQWSFRVELEPVAEFAPNWRYFHAKSQAQVKVPGYTPGELLHTRGSGHWVGMSLYGTGHDHGGGDFAVTDGGSKFPSFLHGVNGEDYFSFAWFGSGANLPYSEAFDNDTGRMRLHLENPKMALRDHGNIHWAAIPQGGAVVRSHNNRRVPQNRETSFSERSHDHARPSRPLTR
jgi:hypothetical protein